jgi:hypothetical protein
LLCYNMAMVKKSWLTRLEEADRKAQERLDKSNAKMRMKKRKAAIDRKNEPKNYKSFYYLLALLAINLLIFFWFAIFPLSSADDNWVYIMSNQLTLNIVLSVSGILLAGHNAYKFKYGIVSNICVFFILLFIASIVLSCFSLAFLGFSSY